VFTVWDRARHFQQLIFDPEPFSRIFVIPNQTDFEVDNQFRQFWLTKSCVKSLIFRQPLTALLFAFVNYCNSLPAGIPMSPGSIAVSAWCVSQTDIWLSKWDNVTSLLSDTLHLLTFICHVWRHKMLESCNFCCCSACMEKLPFDNLVSLMNHVNKNLTFILYL